MAYIPKAHEKYDLLPDCRKRGGEVFSYPCRELNELERLLPEGSGLTPYGYDSYEEYYAHVDSLAALHGVDDGKVNALGEKFLAYKALVRRMNVKEDWSVLRYVGKTTQHCLGLTHGRYYYWPCSAERPVYEGVVDDEEFTSYLYPTEPALWEIAEDPLGMAYATIFKGQNALSEKGMERINAQIERMLKQMDEAERRYSQLDIQQGDTVCLSSGTQAEVVTVYPAKPGDGATPDFAVWYQRPDGKLALEDVHIWNVASVVRRTPR